MAERLESVLVTGGAGFLGTHVCRALLRRGARLAVVDRFHAGYAPAWKRENLEHLRRAGKFDFFSAELADSAALEQAFRAARPDAVIHLAARASVPQSLEQPGLFQQVNVGGTLRVLELCRALGVRKLVFGSSITVYGAAPAPFREEQNDLAPLSPYAATKLAGEAYCCAYARLFDLPVVCLRLSTIYGPRQRADISVHRFLAAVEAGRPVTIFGDGSAARDYTFVDDAAAGVLAALGYAPAERPPCEVLNLGGGRPLTLLELLAAIEQATGRPARREFQPARPGDAAAAWADITKAGRLLGYRPATPLELGLARLVAWYRRSGTPGRTGG